MVGFRPWSSPRPRASRGTPRWCGPRRRRSSASTSTAPWPRSSRTRSGRTSTPTRARCWSTLAEQVRAVAVITGRPARQALDLGGLEAVGNAIGDAGKELFVFGQYGNERWSSTNRRVISPRPPHGLATFLRDLPRLLRRPGAEDAHVEEKGLAVAVHTRRLADPDATYDVLLPAAARPGGPPRPGGRARQQVIEVRSPGMHKGLAVDRLVDGARRRRLLFVGDDLGDIEAFEAVAALAKDGLPDPAGLLGVGRGERARPAVRRRRPRPRGRPRPPASADRRRRRPARLTSAGVRPQRTPEHRPRPGS